MRARSLFLLLLTAAIVSFCIDLRAQTKPNYSGEWTMVLDKSDFGPMPAPSAVVRTVTHTEPDIKVVTKQTTDQGETTTTLALSTDEKPHTNTVQGNQMTSVAKWDGSAITVKGTLSMQGVDITIDERWELSDAGKTLTITRKFATPDGDAATKIVYTKTK
jgi:hypothetical protein